MALENSMAGITDKILTLPLITVEITPELIKNALDETAMKKIVEWRENLKKIF